MRDVFPRCTRVRRRAPVNTHTRSVPLRVLSTDNLLQSYSPRSPTPPVPTEPHIRLSEARSTGPHAKSQSVPEEFAGDRNVPSSSGVDQPNGLVPSERYPLSPQAAPNQPSLASTCHNTTKVPCSGADGLREPRALSPLRFRHLGPTSCSRHCARRGSPELQSPPVSTSHIRLSVARFTDIRAKSWSVAQGTKRTERQQTRHSSTASKRPGVGRRRSTSRDGGAHDVCMPSTGSAGGTNATSFSAHRKLVDVTGDTLPTHQSSAQLPRVGPRTGVQKTVADSRRWHHCKVAG
ncbi:hypothetical protein C8Q80DRAFT_210256 [Daedaleopsis nitida]|nr:hypothetical protein C8Q80DRAFT_210256 [Daedaleopsis nitida]